MRKSSRRTKGEGSFYELPDGRWRAIVEMPPENGKRKRKYIEGKKSVVRARLAELVHAGAPESSSRITLNRYFDEWLSVVKRERAPKTYENARLLPAKHVLPRLGHLRLSALTPRHFSALDDQLAEAGVGPSVRKKLHQILRAALGRATRLKMIPENPLDRVDAPSYHAQERPTLTIAQVNAFLKVAAEDRMHALFVLELMSGMREGELFALEWRDVDLRSGQLALQRQARARGTSKPKADSRRQIMLTKPAIRALSKLKEARMQDGLAGCPLVFPSTTGTKLHPSNFRRRIYYPLLERAGLGHYEGAGKKRKFVPLVHFHDLRHTFATALLKAGVHPKIVQEILGHSSIRVTMVSIRTRSPRCKKTPSTRSSRYSASRSPKSL